MAVVVALLFGTTLVSGQATANTVDKAGFLSIFKVLEPLNIYTVDRASKDIFEDFFTQKNKIYTPASAKQSPFTNNSTETVQKPAKIQRRGF